MDTCVRASHPAHVQALEKALSPIDWKEIAEADVLLNYKCQDAARNMRKEYHLQQVYILVSGARGQFG
jgi:hypothetical protein